MLHCPSLPISPDEPWLAPLAGFSDLPFRLLCRELGARVACTEMISAKGVLYNSPSTERLLASCPGDVPLVVQLFGAEPKSLGRAVQELLRRGFSWFDLNAGCPVKKVVRTGAGAALLKAPLRLEEAVRRMLEAAGPARVGVKIRSGWEEGQEVYLHVAEQLSDVELGWMTLHPRSAKQGFRGNAAWNHLGRLRRSVPFPIVGSGDLLTAADGWSCLQKTGIDAVMFARGALQDPFVFSRFRQQASEQPGTTQSPDLPKAYCRERHLQDGYRGRLALARRHIDLSRCCRPERDAFVRMRPMVARHLRSFPRARQLRQEVMRCRDWEGLLELLDRLEGMV